MFMEWKLACSMVGHFSQWPFGEERFASSNSEHDFFKTVMHLFLFVIFSLLISIP